TVSAMTRCSGLPREMSAPPSCPPKEKTPSATAVAPWPPCSNSFVPSVERPAEPALALADRQATPLSVYVHLPWCVAKCPYCDFNSHRTPDKLPETEYVDALIADWALAATEEDRPVESIFF